MFSTCFTAILVATCLGAVEPTSPAARERLVLDDFHDISAWQNGSPEETTLERSPRAKVGSYSLKFANRVDYERGEKAYPVGWPRTARDFAKRGPTDWSDYDYVEFWVYVETSRASLPASPINVGFSHSGNRRSSNFTLKEVRKDQWVHFELPIAKFLDPKDVRRVQFNISESNYKHGDQVDFYINDLVLTRHTHPVVAQFETLRHLAYDHDRAVTACYTLLGRQGLDKTNLRLEIGLHGGAAVASANAPPNPAGELPLKLSGPLAPGSYWARLTVVTSGKTVDEKETAFRVIPGPFAGRKDHGPQNQNRLPTSSTTTDNRKPVTDNRLGPVLRFDMGTADSPLRDGFARVTAKMKYSSQLGFGWRDTAGLKTHYQPYSREWKKNESRGRSEPPKIYANEITCDTISSNQPNAFLVDLPAGRYQVYALAGLSQGSPRDYHWFDLQAGTAKTTVKIPGAYRFEKRSLPVDHGGGTLAIELRPETDWLLAAVAVFPAAAEQQVRGQWLDALEREVEFLPPDVAGEWKFTPHVDPRAWPQWSQADQARGYALFARHWSEIIYPNTVPRSEELNPELAIFAAPGEYEPATFTIRPLRAAARARVFASGLRGPGGEIPASRIDIRYVRTMYVRPNYSTYFAYHLAPDVLEHREAIPLRPEENQRVWITVHVPEDAAAGLYEGQLTFAPEGGTAAVVPLAVRVLPIRLAKNPDHLYGAYYHDPLRNVDPKNTPQANAYFRRRAELERQDMREHGMNTHTIGLNELQRDEQGRWTADGTRLEEALALSRQYGLADRPMALHFPTTWWYEKLVDRRGTGSHLRLMRPDVPQSYFDEVTRMVEAIQREKQKYPWPELLYYPVDEPSGQPASINFMVQILKAVKQVRGARTYITADPSEEHFEPLWPWVDVWCCQPFVFDAGRIAELSRKHHAEFWCYPNHISGENDHTPVRGARMTWGFGFWKSGFKALIPWIYAADVGDPWNYLDGTSMDFMNRSTPDGEPVPVALWEAFREGIDDGRYLFTLQQLLAKSGKAAGVKTAGAAREIDELGKAFVPQEKYKYDGLWSGADFDAWRWALARQILELQGK